MGYLRRRPQQELICNLTESEKSPARLRKAISSWRHERKSFLIDYKKIKQLREVEQQTDYRLSAEATQFHNRKLGIMYEICCGYAYTYTGKRACIQYNQ